MLLTTFILTLGACQDSDWDRHALTGPESNRLVASVEIEPSGAVIDLDENEQFAALVKSGMGQTVSTNVTWNSSDERVLRVDGSGSVVGLNEGTAVLVASHRGVQGQVTVDVKGEVVKLRLNRSALELGEGEAAQLEATYVYANGAERPAGPLEWRSSDPSILQVDSDGLVHGVGSGTTKVRVRGRGHEALLDGRVRAGSVASVDVVATATSLVVGEEVRFWAEIRDGQGNRLVRPVQWSSSNATVASVNDAGLVKAKQPGEAIIRARAGGVTGSAGVRVGASGAEKEARPSPVTGLNVQSTGTLSATLRFTEVDDGTGQPSHYDLRYAESQPGWNWGRATSVAKGSCKVPIRGTGIGSTRSCTVEGLQPGTKYDFQLVPFRGVMNQGATYGPLSNLASGTTQAPPIRVEVLPSGATLSVGQSRELTATVLDLYGNRLDRTVIWSSSRPFVASIDADGNTATVTALSLGDTDVRATHDGVHDTSRIRVIQPANTGGGGSARTPNEPGNFVRIAEHDFSCRPGEGCAAAGRWSESSQDWHRSNLSIVERADAPVSGSRVIRTRFPSGMGAGLGPVSFGGWSAPGEEYRAVYISKWIRIAGPDYENHPILTKMGWIGYGQSSIDNQGYLALQSTSGSGRVEKVTRLQPSFRQQNHVGRAEWGSELVRVGEWSHWEILLELNDLGRANGVFRWWIDGRLAISRNDMVYINSGNERGFFSYRWNPTWGGTGDFRKTRDDFMEIDHIYISGRR